MRRAFGRNLPKMVAVGTIALLAVAVLISAYMLGLRATGPVTVADSAATPILVAELPDAVWDLEYDSIDDAVWFVSGNGQAAEVFRVSTVDGKVVSWSVPDGEYSGVHRDVHHLANGDVMLSSDYGLVRLSSETGELESVLFDVEVDGALPGALDPNTPLPGTWISATAIIDGNVVVARQNVPFLTVVSGKDLSELERIVIPVALAGARDIAGAQGELYVLGSDGALVSVGTGMKTIATGVAQIDYANGVGFLATMASNGAVAPVASGKLMPALVPGADEPALVTVEETGMIGIYDTSGATVTLLAGTGIPIKEVALPLREVPARTEQMITTMPPQLNDMVVTKAGSVWYVTSDERGLWRTEE